MLIFRLLRLFALFLPISLFGQEQLGMRLERYSGMFGAALNPAQSAWMPHNWEVSLFSADLFLENNYAYLRQTSLQNALKNSDLIIAASDLSPDRPPPPNAIVQDFFDRDRNMRGVLQTRVAGPGFAFRFGERHVAGLSTAVRAHFSSYRIPGILRYYNVSDIPLNSTLNIPSTGFELLTWAEIGAHYSYRNTDSDIHTAFGISPKLFLGYESVFLRAQTNFDYTPLAGDSVAFAQANWDYAFTASNLTDDVGETRLKRNGTGFALDFGYSWAIPGETDGDYRLKVNAGLIDAGFVGFKKNAQRHHLEFDSRLEVGNADFPPRDNAQDIIHDVSKAFLGDSLATLESRSFIMGLPTAMSLQLDVKAAPFIYVTGAYIQRLPIFRYHVKRPNTFALIPRFEHRWFSFSAPMVLNDWQSFRVGLSARLAWLYIGTDNIGSFMGKERLTGADFYIGLKINGFALHFGGVGLKRNRGGGGGTSSKQKLRKIKCYEF